MAWDPKTYNQFKQERLLPLIDLIQKIPKKNYNSILDLGCGTGVATPYLKELSPNAKITGLDNSEEMLEEAKEKYSDCNYLNQDINSYNPPTPFDLIFSDAALHFINRHEELLPRVMSFLNPGGVLAIQIPNNWNQPSHQIMNEVAYSSHFKDKTGHLIRRSPVLNEKEYLDCLKNISHNPQFWETTYMHKMEGKNPIFQWLKGTSLKILLTALDPKEKEKFSNIIKTKLAKAYPPNSEGITILPFRRIFLLAEKP